MEVIIDITTDGVTVLPGLIQNDDTTAIKTAILEAVKQLPEFHQQKPERLILRHEQSSQNINWYKIYYIFHKYNSR
jgi:hypothetical protein